MEETHSQEEGNAEKRAKTERSDKETEAAVEAGPSQSRYKKGHITNICLTDSDVIGTLLRTTMIISRINQKECLWEQFANSCKLSVKVCKTLFELQRTHYVNLTQTRSGDDRMSELDTCAVGLVK